MEYLGGSLTGEELRELENRVSQSPENEKFFKDYCELWLSSEAVLDKSFDSEKAFGKFRRAHRPKAAISFRYRYIIAACAIVILSLLSFWGGKESIKSDFSDIVAEAPAGAATKLYLPDGSQVFLNANSKLKYSQGFGVSDRNVELDGEAYFEVARDERLPFKVNTNVINAKVLGTKFNFCNYKDDLEAVVTLAEGKLEIENLLSRYPQIISLSPNQSFVLEKMTGKARVVTKKAENVSMWTSGVLFFDETLLCDIAKKLERAYNVNISLGDKRLEKMRIYGSFNMREQTVEEIISVMASTHSLNYSKVGNNYTLF